MSINKDHIARIKTILGPRGWKQDQDALAPYLSEWRDQWRGHTPLLALPDSTEKVAELVSFCADHKITITTQGGNTGLVGGQIPYGELLLCTERLNTIRALDVQNATLTVEAGVTLAQAQEAASNARLVLPLSLASESAASIGGVLSTNAGGMEVLRYGNAREMALGLEVVTANGSVWSALKGLRKDNSGYDLKQLFIGAEGTLGVITAAVLRLFPAPTVRISAWCALSCVKDAVALLALVREKCGSALCKFELIPKIGVECAIKNVPGNRAVFANAAPWNVLLELGFFDPAHAESTLENALGEALNKDLIQDAAIAQSETQAADFLRLRESLSAAQKGEGVALKHDISVPVSAIATFINEASAQAKQIVPACRIFAFGHIGDGNVHFNVLQPAGMKAEIFSQSSTAITQAVFACALALGGSVSAEHGVGVLKKAALHLQKSDVEMQMMRTIKAALDPHNIMNPRVLF